MMKQRDLPRHTLSRKEAGFTLIEVLVSLSLTTLAAASIAASLSTALTVSKLTEAHYAASSLEAISKIPSQD